MMLAKTLAFAFTFALPLLLVRRLNQTEFGVYKQVFLFVGTASALLPIGVGMSAFYFLPRERERQQQIVLNILLFHAFTSGMACLALVLRPALLAALFNSKEMIGYAPLVGIVVMTWAISSALEIITIARQDLRLATLFIIAAQFTKSLFLLVAAIFFATVEALLYAAIAQGVLQLIILLLYLRSRFGRFWWGFEWSVMRMQLAYALPLGFASLLSRAQTELDNYFVSHRFSAATYAIYAVGCFELPLLGLLTESIGWVTIPHVSYLQKNGSRREIVRLIANMMRKLSALVWPLYAFLLVMGREFITILFTSQYLPSWPIFAVNLTLVPLTIITSACDPVMRAYAEHRYFQLRLRGVLLVLFVVGLWFGMRLFGLMGAVTVMVGINVIDRLIIGRKVKNILGITRRDLALFKDIGKLAVAAAAAAIVTVFVRPFMLGAKPFVVFIAGGCAFSIAYLLAVLLLGIMTTDERGAIQRQVVRLQRYMT